MTYTVTKEQVVTISCSVDTEYEYLTARAVLDMAGELEKAVAAGMPSDTQVHVRYADDSGRLGKLWASYTRTSAPPEWVPAGAGFVEAEIIEADAP